MSRLDDLRRAMADGIDEVLDAVDPLEDPWIEGHRRALERHARLVELARHNGYDVELVNEPWLPGLWWLVPPQLVGVVGCMKARVA